MGLVDAAAPVPLTCFRALRRGRKPRDGTESRTKAAAAARRRVSQAARLDALVAPSTRRGSSSGAGAGAGDGTGDGDGGGGGAGPSKQRQKFDSAVAFAALLNGSGWAQTKQRAGAAARQKGHLPGLRAPPHLPPWTF
jgi:hypothetical protein